jgi:hypothetical protein
MNPKLRRVVREVVRTGNRPVATARFRAAVRKAQRPIALEVGGL